MKGYDTAEYAGTRLIETIIMYKGVPVKVNNCLQDKKGIYIQGVDVINGLATNDYLDNFDMNPPLLGYVNAGKQCIYMSRMPMRKDWKQGLRKNNIIAYNGQIMDMNMKHIAYTIIGKFPSIPDILKLFSKKNPDGYVSTQSQAFHRDFAIHKDGRIWYKSVFAIGVIDFQTGGIKIDPGFEWTREALMEVVGEFA